MLWTKEICEKSKLERNITHIPDSHGVAKQTLIGIADSLNSDNIDILK